MLAGLATSGPAGAAEECLLVFERLDFDDGAGCRLTLQAWDGYGDSYWIVVCDGKIVAVVYLPEGERREVAVIYDIVAADSDGNIEHSVSVVPNGGWNNASFVDAALQQRDFLSDKAKSVQIDWDCLIEVLSAFGDAAQFSNWSLTGLRRGLNGRPVTETHSRLDVVLSDDGSGNYTVSLQMGDFVAASGTRAGNGVVTLAEQNDSGLSGSVTLAFTADLPLGDAFIDARWAAKYEIHAGLSPMTFPRTPEAIALDNGLGNRLSSTLVLAPGTHQYLVRAISDTLITGNDTAVDGTIIVPGRPLPITALALQASPGDNTGTNIQWQHSATPGATYRVYDSALDTPTDFHVIAGTHAAASGLVTFTLPAIGAAAGKRRVVVVAVNAGIEDGYRESLTIEYADDGSIVLPRPNVPSFQFASKSGRALTVRYSYNHAGELGIGATVNLYLVRKDGTLTLASPNATASLPAGNDVVTGTIAATTAFDDWYQYLIVIGTAVGVLSQNTVLQGPEWLSAAVPGVVQNVAATLVG